MGKIVTRKCPVCGKRVVRFDNPDGTNAEKYAHFHDAWAEL